MQKSLAMIEDTEWWERVWDDKGFRVSFETHEQTIRHALLEEMCANKDNLSEGYVLPTPIFPSTNRYPQGVFEFYPIFEALQEEMDLPYEGASYKLMLPYLEQAAYRTDPDGQLYRQYRLSNKPYNLNPDGDLNQQKLDNLSEYFQEYAEEFTYHFLKLARYEPGYEFNTYLTRHPLMGKYGNPTGATITGLNIAGSSPELEAQIKAVVRSVGRFQAKATP